ncbi:hypothetical protein [Rhodococcus sovatensis]|uniref:Uncharacterized protein n=1 Tax=Rhodococcus sovatensis TaxID=1805840 RepID=A0ABZ2PJR8_9NOCA
MRPTPPAELVGGAYLPRSASRVRALTRLLLITTAILTGFAILGAVVATPLLGLVCGLMTLGLIGLGWVMV